MFGPTRGGRLVPVGLVGPGAEAPRSPIETLFISRSGLSSCAKAIAEIPQKRVNSRNIGVNGLGLVIQVPPVTHGFVGQQLRALSRDSHLEPPSGRHCTPGCKLELSLPCKFSSLSQSLERSAWRPRLSVREFIIKSGAVGPTKRGNGTKIIALADDHSLLLAVSIESASPHEKPTRRRGPGHSFHDTLPAR